jgi:hypothetical protein
LPIKVKSKNNGSFNKYEDPSRAANYASNILSNNSQFKDFTQNLFTKKIQMPLPLMISKGYQKIIS